MYEAGGGERIVPIDPPLPEADAGAPSPAVAATEHGAAVAYWTADYEDPSERRVGVVVFHSAYDILFGPPSDETFHGHPLYPAGLRHYVFAEVLGSPWVAARERRNRVHPRHDPERFETLRHFVLPFHDSTFECLSREVRGTVTNADDPATALLDFLRDAAAQ